MTDITVEKYRSFLSNYPEKVTYYQPILDTLDYKPSNIENIPDVVILEGKNDFYCLSYFQEIIKESNEKINFLPGTGSGNMGTIISLYIAWGRNFIVLLDSDNAGSREKERYVENFGKIVENSIFTFEDIDNNWADSKMEDLISAQDKLNIVQSIEPTEKSTGKKKLFLFLQENLVNNNYVSISTETKENFQKVLTFLSNTLKERK